LKLYEQLEIIVITGLNYYNLGAIYKDKYFISTSERIKYSLKEFIIHHPCISSPVYDDHIIEIILAIIFLPFFG
jgi:hypothetical protein